MMRGSIETLFYIVVHCGILLINNKFIIQNYKIEDDYGLKRICCTA